MKIPPLTPGIPVNILVGLQFWFSLPLTLRVNMQLGVDDDRVSIQSRTSRLQVRFHKEGLRCFGFFSAVQPDEPGEHDIVLKWLDPAWMTKFKEWWDAMVEAGDLAEPST